jgi:3-deoxy-D-manno-octulosonate 8-phosphate phosphatase (KDO 8-P phosphatase)
LAKSRQLTAPPKVFVIDVDGVMTDGSFLYDQNGKFAKRFSSDDHDALSLLKPYMQIQFVSGDGRGFDISDRRIAKDMKMPLELVSTIERVAWISERFDPATVAYMGDGIFDAYVFQEIGYAITVADALDATRAHADYVTSRRGGDRAVAEAVLHLLHRFFEPFDLTQPARKGLQVSGTWTVGGGDPAPTPLDTARRYFERFAQGDLDGVAELFADAITLKDWNLEVAGKPDVVAATRAVMAGLGAFKLTVAALHPTQDGAIAELCIETGGLRVDIVDVLAIDKACRITGITAYKGVEREVDPR